MPLLVKFSKNWADEFDCNGFKLYMSTEEWLIEKVAIENATSFHFGTNQGWEDDEVEDFIDNYTVEKISFEEYEALEKLLPECATSYGYGIFPRGSEDDGDEEEYEATGEDNNEDESEGSPS